MAFCSIQQHLIRDIRARFGIINLPHSPDIKQNLDLDRGIPNIRIFGQSLMKENFHDSRANDDVDMKLGP